MYLGENCTCRKPRIGMLLEASNKYNLDLSKCIVIGDRWTDMLAAEEAGSFKILVQTGSGKESLQKFHNKEYYGRWNQITTDFIAHDLNEAIHWILNES